MSMLLNRIACVNVSLKELHARDRNAQLSVFPSYIRANMHELIRNRNAAAHKTRVPLGNYEALLRCILSLPL